MGKKSKRRVGGDGGNNEKQQRTSAASNDAVKEEEVETKENLRFEDPFVDEIIQEEDVVENNDDDDDDDDSDDDDDDMEGEEDESMKPPSTAGAAATNRSKMNMSEIGGGDDVEVIQSWHPLMGHKKEDGKEEIELEMDPTAYKMYHTLTPEWPSLSFDLLRDNLGENRQRYPHTLQAVVGTQADNPSSNKLTVLKLSDLSKLPQDKDDDEEDILGDEYDKDGDGSDSDDEEEDLDLDPILEHYSLPHYGGVNRLRVMPQNQNIVATWSDVGKVNLYDIEELRNRFEISEGRGNNNKTSSIPKNNGPFFSYDGHSSEGFAIDWSDVTRGSLATGDNDGNIHLWTSNEDGSSYTVSPSYETPGGVSIEDLQWSPTESTVICAAESNGHVAIYDTRAPNKAMLRPYLHPNTDVNVLSWNKLVSNLLATGADDGTLCVWDLRHFGGGDDKKKAPEPLARFTCHQTPVTSVEWHPTDESMLAMSDEVGVYIYDLSVEEDVPSSPYANNDNSNDIQQLVADIPPQLLFCHSGSKQFKECHWHPQISSCVMTTAYSGFSVFVPSNL
jgi:ribosome assembly protein RRB1